MAAHPMDVRSRNTGAPVDPQTMTAANGKLRLRVNSQGNFEVVGLNADTFMSPLSPLPPQTQDPRFGTIGRRWDYPVGINTFYTPRGNAQISFADLRALANNYDLLRTVIETRKDQMCGLDWKLAYKSKDKRRDGKIDSLETMFLRPDRRIPYITWLRSCLEDVFVTDALTIYPTYTNDGSFFGFDQINGDLIKPVIDAQGRVPDPPSPAYQQILKGLPAVDYQLDELVYWPRNPRVNSLYGYSPVEQIIVTVNIALRRQIFQLDYYRQGSIPDALINVADSWTAEQLMQFQQYWDAQFMNPGFDNIGERRKLKFMPPGKVTFAKDALLKDEYDEWLARIVCFAFSISPQPFIKQMNRGTGETQKELSTEEGLVPLKKWWKALMDYLVQQYLGATDVEFMWDEEEAVDPKTSSDIQCQEVDRGIVTVNEVRAERGLEPLEGEEADQPHLQTTEQTLDANGKPIAAPSGQEGAQPGQKPPPPPAKPAAGNPKEKLAKAAPRERQVQKIQRERLTRAVKRQLRGWASTVNAAVSPLIGKGTSADMMGAIDFASMYKTFPAAVADPLKRASADAVRSSVAPLKKDREPVEVAITDGFVNDYADAYAKARGAEMVGMKWVDGELVDNPDPYWAITDETRTGIASLLDDAVNQGWGVDQFAEALGNAYAFSATRAEMIARTETRLADSKGNLAGWKQSGVVAQKVWLISNDGCCDDCQDNADEGPIDLDDDFPSGDDSCPAHPNCKCVIAPVVGDDSEE